MTNKSLAERFTDAQILVDLLEEKIDDALQAVGIPTDFEWWADYYDMSIEFKTPQGWEFTAEQETAVHSVGFHRCWLNYPGNKTENVKNEKAYYWGPSK